MSCLRACSGREGEGASVWLLSSHDHPPTRARARAGINGSFSSYLLLFFFAVFSASYRVHPERFVGNYAVAVAATASFRSAVEPKYGDGDGIGGAVYGS